MRDNGKSKRMRLMLSVAASALAISYGTAFAQEKAPINIAPQPLTTALYEFGGQTGREVMFTPGVTAAKTTAGVSAGLDDEAALADLLRGTGLTFRLQGGVFVITQQGEGGSSPQSASAGGDVEALIVTAQKREENIQDVPIAISAFSQQALETQKIEGGFDLLKAIPNVTFSKNNFTSYNFSIRGIGTKAVSATTDPGVAVSFNNTALLQNRLFEQEYFDVERVEVLRGPQGTLYGRNATAGVINVISAKPDLGEFDGWVKGEVGNYQTKRVSAMVNIPLVEDKLAIRFAGALTDRQGYDYNSVTKNAVNGRDLWSARVTVGFEPTERLRGNFIWERFEEDDNRSRTGKQVCHRDDGPEALGSLSLMGTDLIGAFEPRLVRALYSQGCKAGSLYDDAAFGTPNGLALPFVFGVLTINRGLYPIGANADGDYQLLIKDSDPYGGKMQSRDLRTIASFKDPRYSAKADIVEFNLDFDLTDSLTFTSQTAYNKDRVYSFQDYNRFNTEPIFNDTSTYLDPLAAAVGDPNPPPSPWRGLAPGGVFCDPQLGCSNTLAGFDISQAKSTQFSQEFRLQSDFDGPVNFAVGANYTHFKATVDYYVMYNLITAYALMRPFYDALVTGGLDITTCPTSGFLGVGPEVEAGASYANCPYIDPNPVESINGEGHNYFRSKNPYKLSSSGYFGELYWQASESLKFTAGLRYTDDRKIFIPVPSQVLMAPGVLQGGYVSRGYPGLPAIEQHWGEWTGRIGVDWKPELSFTDSTMVYAFYSRGYKGGGANPPQPGFATTADLLNYGIITPEEAELYTAINIIPYLQLTAVDYGPTFEPEFVNAFEIGSKNTLLSGALQLNTGAFYYDYKDYQVSQIKDRTAVNENFDATIWGLEFEAVFSPMRDLQIIGNLGYLDTRIADGETSIDIMNRTQGNPDFVVVKPWLQLPSNCVVPLSVAEANPIGAGNSYADLCGGLAGAVDTLFDYDDYPEINGGAGIRAQLGGNKLPNSPHWTANLGVQYGMDVLDNTWRITLRGDAYWQSQSWARVYNAVNDKLHGWYNMNLSVWIERPEDNLRIELYAKNLLDKTPITDAFLNSDDTALTTNVFVLDPRLIGLSIKKGF